MNAKVKSKKKHTNRGKQQKKKPSKIKMIENVATPATYSESNSLVEVSTQLNRFHEATVDHSSKDIFLNGVNIKIGDNDLLIVSQLKIESSCRYGLVGRNGIGKSTLLKALGNDMFEGISSSLRILYVDQLEDQNEFVTVIETVLAADIEANQLKRKLELLQEVVGENNQEMVIQTIQKVVVEDLAEDVRIKLKIAEKRSGDR
jgi:ATP-binding cassette subfamily F protein 3